MSSIADDCDAAARAVRRSDNLFMFMVYYWSAKYYEELKVASGGIFFSDF